MPNAARKELVLVAALLVFGLFVLPYAVYLVGTRVFGPYSGEGPVDLSLAIWSGLARLEWPAWVLVLGPYLTVQLLRLAARTARGRAKL